MSSAVKLTESAAGLSVSSAARSAIEHQQAAREEKSERLVGRGHVSRDECVVLKDVIYRITVGWGGSVFGEIRAPHHVRLASLVAGGPADWLRLRLEDGRQVFFQLRRAEAVSGGWGDLEGRLAP
jgi:hypothetical protein